jgi:hypothetical protein
VPGGVAAREVVHAVVPEAGELLSSGDGAAGVDAAYDDLAVAVDAADVLRNGGRVNEQCPCDAALMTGDLRADVNEQRASTVAAVRSGRRDGLRYRHRGGGVEV